jgi:DNA-binding transcriptional MerR regulator
MNIGDVAEWVGLADSTIRKYIRDFGDVDGAFSQSATPSAGRHRRFTNHDVAVLAWISKQYQEHRMPTDDIRAALVEMLDSGEVFEEPPRPEDEQALALIPREQHEEILAANQRALELALAEKEALERIMENERNAHRQERADWQTEIARLNREVGRLAQIVRQLGEDPQID